MPPDSLAYSMDQVFALRAIDANSAMVGRGVWLALGAPLLFSVTCARSTVTRVVVGSDRETQECLSAIVPEARRMVSVGSMEGSPVVHAVLGEGTLVTYGEVWPSATLREVSRTKIRSIRKYLSATPPLTLAYADSRERALVLSSRTRTSGQWSIYIVSNLVEIEISTPSFWIDHGEGRLACLEASRVVVYDIAEARVLTERTVPTAGAVIAVFDVGVSLYALLLTKQKGGRPWLLAIDMYSGDSQYDLSLELGDGRDINHTFITTIDRQGTATFCSSDGTICRWNIQDGTYRESRIEAGLLPLAGSSSLIIATRKTRGGVGDVLGLLDRESCLASEKTACSIALEALGEIGQCDPYSLPLIVISCFIMGDVHSLLCRAPSQQEE